METLECIDLGDLNLLDVGNTIQLHGAIYSSADTVYIVPLPDDDALEIVRKQNKLLCMDVEEWAKFLLQSDVLDVKGPGKAILRKSQRQVDQNISWQVYERDGYVCRYCARRVPLTVDHVILWEEGGQSVADNLISACRRCNKVRGSMQYDEWLKSKDYAEFSKGLSFEARLANDLVAGRLPELRKAARPDNLRSR